MRRTLLKYALFSGIKPRSTLYKQTMAIFLVYTDSHIGREKRIYVSTKAPVGFKRRLSIFITDFSCLARFGWP